MLDPHPTATADPSLLCASLCSGKLEEYMQLLVDAFNPAAAEGLMCRDTISVGWDGR